MNGTRTAQVRVPASCSNLGAGFDCVGFAVDRWLTASVIANDGPARAGAADITVQRGGTLAALTIVAGDDALATGFAAACAAAGRELSGRIALTATSEIPLSRGLGSSSAALIAGAWLANEALALGLDTDAIAQLCAGIEGHPDNVGPALLGGAVLGVPHESEGDGASRWVFTSIAVHADLAFAFVVPPFPIETAAARAMLPRELPYDVAVRAVGKSAALVHGLATANAELLRLALDDVMHVPFRRGLVPGLEAIVAAARVAGAYGATISGSGSTLVAIAPSQAVEQVAAAMRRRWREVGVEVESFVQRRPGIGASVVGARELG